MFHCRESIQDGGVGELESLERLGSGAINEQVEIFNQFSPLVAPYEQNIPTTIMTPVSSSPTTVIHALQQHQQQQQHHQMHSPAPPPTGTRHIINQSSPKTDSDNDGMTLNQLLENGSATPPHSSHSSGIQK